MIDIMTVLFLKKFTNTSNKNMRFSPTLVIRMEEERLA